MVCRYLCRVTILIDVMQRCDGERPNCGPCNRRNDKCQYTDQRGLSKTQALEEHMTYLKSRIHDLENVTESSFSVLSSHPSQMQAQSLGMIYTLYLLSRGQDLSLQISSRACNLVPHKGRLSNCLPSQTVGGI
jgi:Fungal Zn(2)-Cys(6) binuclear cluster domain